jgi:hypothetical protein
MRNLYVKKGGQDGQFNCVPVQLTEEDLNALEKDIRFNKLSETNGLFFGTSYPEDKYRDLAFIQRARMALDEGKVVYYTSWW